MKIAVCISGQPRTFKSSFNSFVEFIDGFNYDIFISTWDFQIKEDYLGSYRYKDEGTLAEFIELYQPKDFKIEKWDEQKEQEYSQIEKELVGENYREDNYIRRYIPMLYKIWDVNEIRKKYELYNNIKYDIIIRTRSDIKYSILFKDLLKLEKELYTDIYGNGRNGSGDVFAFGKSSGIDHYCNLFKHINNHKYANECELNTEVLLDYHLKRNNVKYELFDGKLEIIRPK